MVSAELVFLRESQPILTLRLDRAETCIGRHPTNDVVVPEPTIPEVAALLIDRGARRFLLRDLTEGALEVNGQPMGADEQELKDGDEIRVGSYALRLQLPAPQERPAAGSDTAVLGEEERGAEEAALLYRGERRALNPARPFNIGSEEDNDLRIEDDFVSQFHCRLTCQGGRWFIADLASTNGTEVNGLKVRESELPSTALIRIGRVSMTFERSDGRKKLEPKELRLPGLIAESVEMRQVLARVQRLADARESVLITGESGCGKELIARAFHEHSGRARKPYLALNCGALTATLTESELFGYVRGAFTGANNDKLGAFEATSGGTLFLDEIGELPLDLQPKLLRVLELSVVRRVGGNKEIPVDTRVVAATHRNLGELVREGRFREDLYHRLAVLTVHIPPLRDRIEDILPLAYQFLRTQSPQRTFTFDKSAEAMLMGYAWPGNIRELRNTVVRAILLCDRDVIRSQDLQFSGDAFSGKSDARRSVRDMESGERERMEEVLARCKGNQAEAARMMGVSKSTFHDRAKRYGIVFPRKPGPAEEGS